MRANEIAALLAAQAESVCRYLLPNGKINGSEYEVGSICGEKGKSLKIHLTGSKSGWWKDFADGNSGDLIGLWVKIRNLSLFEAISEAKQYLGINEPELKPHKPSKCACPRIKCNPIDLKSPIYEYLIKKRLLTKETIDAFKIRQQDRAIVFPYLIDKKPISAKYLSIDRDENGKKIIWREKGTQQCLFGWQTIPDDTRNVIICEGEIDAMTVYQYGYPALSVPLGAGISEKEGWIEFEYDRLAIFDEIYLCFDNDKAGQKAIESLVDRLGRHRCRKICLPYKDANEALQKGLTKTEFDVFFAHAETLDPPELKAAGKFTDEVINAFYPKDKAALGFPMPFRAFKNNIAFRPTELSVWCGINGHGKSQFLGQLMVNYLINGYRLFVASLELKASIFLQRLYRQISGKQLPTRAHIKKIADVCGNDLFIYNKTTTADITNLLEVFEYAYKRYGVTVFFIDSFMKCNVYKQKYDRQSPTKLETLQDLFIQKLCDFKNLYNCHIHLVTHPRKAENERIIPNKLDVKGSGGITDLPDNCFTIWRNKDKQSITESDATLTCWKQRNGNGWEGKAYLWFDPQSLQFLDTKDSEPQSYIPEND